MHLQPAKKTSQPRGAQLRGFENSPQCRVLLPRKQCALGSPNASMHLSNAQITIPVPRSTLGMDPHILVHGSVTAAYRPYPAKAAAENSRGACGYLTHLHLRFVHDRCDCWQHGTGALVGT